MIDRSRPSKFVGVNRRVSRKGPVRAGCFFRATRARVQRGRETKIGWQTSVGSISAPLGCVLERARTSETKLTTTPQGAGERGVTSLKQSACSVEKREVEETGRTGTCVGAFEGILRTQVNAARAMKIERAPDTTEGALDMESGMPLTGRSRKYPGAAGLRWSALVRVRITRCSPAGAGGAVPVARQRASEVGEISGTASPARKAREVRYRRREALEALVRRAIPCRSIH